MIYVLPLFRISAAYLLLLDYVQCPWLCPMTRTLRSREFDIAFKNVYFSVNGSLPKISKFDVTFDKIMLFISPIGVIYRFPKVTISILFSKYTRSVVKATYFWLHATNVFDFPWLSYDLTVSCI